MAHPRLDQHGVALPGLSLGDLRTDAVAAQPVVEIPAVQLDAELVLDDRRKAWRGPSFGDEAEVAGAFFDPTEHLLGLRFGKFRRTPRTASIAKPCFPLAMQTLLPPPHGAPVDAEEFGHLLL